MIDKLEYLITLAREKHFGRAAEVCGVTQPTLSAGIKQLEAGLGVLLVHRGSRFIGLTPEGERILEWARRIVGDTRAMRQEISALKRGLTGHLRLAAVPSALGMVSALTMPFHAKHPDVRFTVVSLTAQQLLASLENLEIDAGLTYLNEPLGRVRQIPLYREQFRLLVARDNPHAKRKQITWEEVGKVPLCLLAPETQTRRIIDGLLRQAGQEVSPKLESNSMILLFTHVIAGEWATIMPARLAKTLGTTDAVREIPIVEPATSHSIGLVVPSREPMTPIVAALVSEARRLARELEDGALVD